MQRYRNRFATIHIRKKTPGGGAVLLVPTLLGIAAIGMLAAKTGFASTDLIVQGLGRTLPALAASEHSTDVGILGVDLSDPYAVIDESMPIIKSNSALAAKYSALRQDNIKARRGGDTAKTPQKKQEDNPIVQNGKNVLEMDMGNAGNQIQLRNETDYAIDVDGLLAQPLEFDMDSGGPKVLIVHTHTSESYAPSEAFNYTPTDNVRTEDNNFNVVRVGDEIEKELLKNGISVIHDPSLNDYPSYNGSYTKTLGVIEDNLEKYPSIEIVLDVHRDFTERDDGTALKPVTTIDGQKAAQMMFVVGTDAMDLYHPNWKHNLSFALKINQKLNQLYPMLTRCVNIRTERFNQHMTKGSMILEMGSHCNTLDEVLPTGRYVAQAIAAVLKGK